MTKEQLNSFGEKLDAIAEEFRSLVPGADTNLEVVLLGMVELLEEDKKAQTHPLVISALESSMEHLRDAAMDYYVSYK